MPELDDEDCLADAAAVLAARQRVDPLLLRLAAQPFDVAAIDDLRRWIDEVYPLAAPAWVRLLGLPDPQPTTGTEWNANAVLRLLTSNPCVGRRHDDPPSWTGAATAGTTPTDTNAPDVR